MTAIITGVAGFIGSNVARRLMLSTVRSIIGIDRVDDVAKVQNLTDVRLDDFIDYDDEDRIERLLRKSDSGSLFIHQGACTDTLERDARKVMALNFEKSRRWHELCMRYGHRFIYASSAAVYGAESGMDLSAEKPLNVYGLSKLLFDRYVTSLGKKDLTAQTVGLRYFNVYGPREQHKGRMASCVNRFYHQALSGRIDLFEGSDRFKRDFIHVDDVVSVIMHFVLDSDLTGIFNCGTGVATSFVDLACEVKKHQECDLDLIEVPPFLSGSYQKFTQADIRQLRASGYDRPFISVADGVASYIERLKKC